MKYKYNDEWVDLSIKALDSMAIGSIIQFVGTTIPTGWLECDGSTITQSAYPELYALIGGTLPDFRGRVLVGQDTNDTDFDTLLETGGEKTHTLTIDEMPSHNHGVYYVNDGASGALARLTASGSTTPTKNTGGGQAHNNLQPYAVVKHIIKATNTTPTMASIVNGYSTSTQDGYSCDYINDINTYSTSETDTGKRWIDGKKIYRKTFTGSYNSGAELLSGVDTLVNHYGTAFISGATRCVPYMEVYNGNMFDAQFRVLNNKIVSEFMNNGSTTSSNISMTFEYTKTTD